MVAVGLTAVGLPGTTMAAVGITGGPDFEAVTIPVAAPPAITSAAPSAVTTIRQWRRHPRLGV